MLFRDIPGKEQEKQFLINAVKEDRIAHAQLFLGRAGSGQLPLAIAFATYILCKNRQEDDACGTCIACRKNEKYIHPDFHFSFPVIKKDGLARKDTISGDFMKEFRDALQMNPYMDMDYWTQFIGVDNSLPDINTKECQSIVQKLSLKPYESSFKIFMIWMPEFLKKEGNRLLKIIEEPTDNTFIILVAENASEILGTVLSRTQLVKFSPFQEDQIADFLESHYDVSAEQAVQLSSISDGNMSNAISTVGGDLIDYSEELLSWLRTTYKLDPVQMNSWVNNIMKLGRKNQGNFLIYSINVLRNYLLQHYAALDERKINDQELELLKSIAKVLTPESAEGILYRLEESIAHIGRNANGKIIFMALSIDLGRMLRSGKSPYQMIKY